VLRLEFDYSVVGEKLVETRLFHSILLKDIQSSIIFTKFISPKTMLQPEFKGILAPTTHSVVKRTDPNEKVRHRY
jgi:hypothetical protein